jgi:hypothetical protein
MLWHLILPEERASCDFPLLGQSALFYQRQSFSPQSGQVRFVPIAEDNMLVQVRHPVREGTPGAIFFLNTGSHTVQRSFPLIDLGIKDSVYLYHWETQSAEEQAIASISVILSGHHSALYFFSRDPIREPPVRLP